MKRGGWIKRKTAMSRKSVKGQSYAEELAAITPLLTARSHGICEVCHALPATVRHHRLRRSQGGKNTLANLYHVCAPCHDLIHEMPALSYDEGWLLRRAW